jgi:hypothetical protein
VDPLIADNDAVQPMARFSKSELSAESRTRTTANKAAMAKYDKLRMYYSQDLREFTLKNDKLVAFKNEVYNTVSQALRELLLPEQSLRIWLQILSRKCTPTKAQQAELLRASYRKQIAIPVSIKKAENWLLSWEAIMAKIIKYKTPESDHDLWRGDFTTIWNDYLPIAFNNLRQRRLQTANLAPEDYTREIREALQLQHANQKLRQAIRATVFAAESMVTYRQTHYHKLKKFKGVAAITAKGVLPKSLNLLIRLDRKTKRKRLRVTSPRAKAARVRICCKLASL